MTEAPTLLVMAKAPVPGLAKTRLAADLTPHQAAALAAAALLDTLDAALRIPAGRYVVALTGSLERAVAGLQIRAALQRFVVIEQRGDGFADRLANAYLDAAGSGPVVQIASDTPQITAALLGSAFVALDTGSPATIGPATDGGWWLLGLRDATDAAALRSVRMSTPQTAVDTLEALAARGLAGPQRLATLTDVDTVESAALVARAAPETRFARLASVLLPTPGLTRHPTPRSVGSARQLALAGEARA